MGNPLIGTQRTSKMQNQIKHQGQSKRMQLFLTQLDQLEAILVKFKYWQANPLNIRHVDAPFGIGQISFVQWLQFIYLPQMRQILASGQAIPASQIVPYAEEALTDPLGRAEILAQLSRLDTLSLEGGS